ncbi:AMP-binding protein [Aneurinibacillus sp. REN35]|uniref:AMP-binding protein n=1 Tax=Aneurinibacillus sp. REN35 TaxID=3237286 RepID=UPI003526DCBF
MITEGTLLWEPSALYKEQAHITAFMKWLREHKHLDFADYHTLWQWSVDDLTGFWEAIWEYSAIESTHPYRCVLEDNRMPGARWFPGAHVNYAQHILRQAQPGKAAIYHQSEIRPLDTLTWDELTEKVLILANQLRKMGVKPGDRVAAYLPSVPEAVIAMLASASIGAVWSNGIFTASCA